MGNCRPHPVQASLSIKKSRGVDGQATAKESGRPRAAGFRQAACAAVKPANQPGHRCAGGQAAGHAAVLKRLSRIAGLQSRLPRTGRSLSLPCSTVLMRECKQRVRTNLHRCSPVSCCWVFAVCAAAAGRQNRSQPVFAAGRGTADGRGVADLVAVALCGIVLLMTLAMVQIWQHQARSKFERLYYALLVVAGWAVCLALVRTGLFGW